jgi:hypothetical protein
MIEKEFGKLSSQQLRRLFSLLYQGIDNQKELDDLIAEDPEKLSKLFTDDAEWWMYYELPYHQFLAQFFLAFGLGEKIKELAAEEDPQDATLTWAESDPESPLDPNELSDAEKTVSLCLVFAMMKNFTSIKLFHMSINDLLIKAEENDKYFFDALLVDRHVLNTTFATNRIAKAEILGGEQFFDHLSKAIKKSRPRRPKEDLDMFRYMLTALDESMSLSNLSYEKIHEVMVDDLQLYPDDMKDSFSGLKKLIQRRQKYIGT